ncbi:hypothetical protein EDC51_104200 [Bibersteinia trehalosi]|uniref:hypothetical protein n=1 Tax=Bibersteinia trehalosi TaxID=47735 RepID=UPI001047F6BE|nr:hypothetical protein [Bibersteinia trehalosi]TCT16647.1 hypothetical protein EDC51_104200 [Bibersteinia trehalosi]
MYSYLAPQPSDIILEIGAGAGFFSFPIAERIGSDGFLYALDPSEEQLEPFFDKKISNIKPVISSAENFILDKKVHKIWSRGGGAPYKK